MVCLYEFLNHFKYRRKMKDNIFFEKEIEDFNTHPKFLK